MDKVRVGIHHGARGAKALDIDLAILNAALIRKHHVRNGGPDIVIFGSTFHLAGFQFGDIQHVLHQPGQAAGFLRYHAKIMLVLAFRDGAVQHAVNKALDASHGGAQFMGNVAHKLPAGVINVLQAARHVVKGRGKIRQLLTASYGGACGEIAAAQPFGGLADLFDRPGNAPRQHHAQNAADNQDDRRGQQEHRQDGADIDRQRMYRCCSKQITLAAAQIHAAARNIILIVQGIVHGTHKKDILAAVHLFLQVLRDLCTFGYIFAGVHQDVAIPVCHKHKCVR